MTNNDRSNPVLNAARKLNQPFVWVGREHPAYGRYLASLCREVGAKRIVEFGTQCGGSAIPMAQYCKETGAELHVVDLGYEKGSDTLSICMEAMRSLGLADNVIHHRGLAQDVKLSGWFDIVHIDHLKSDYERTLHQILPHLNLGGKVIFHDTDDTAKEYAQEIEKNFPLEWNHDIVGGCAIYSHKLRSVCAYVSTYDEGPYLEYILKWLSPRVGKVLVVESKKTWGNDQDNEKRSTYRICEGLTEENIELVDFESKEDDNPLSRESEERNWALNKCKEEGFKHVWIVDADEVYTNKGASELWKWFYLTREQNPLIMGAGIRWYTYWRSMKWRIEPVEDYIPVVIMDVNAEFREGRLPKQKLVCRFFVCPKAACMVHHYSWSNRPSLIKRKTETWGHAKEVVPDWYENKFAKWTPEMNNLHPTQPEVYKKAVRIEDSELPECVQNHPWSQLEVIKDLNIKVIILNHNKPENSDKLYEQLSSVFDVEVWDSGSPAERIPENLTRSLPNVYWQGAWQLAMDECRGYDVVWMLGCDLTLENDAERYKQAIESAHPFGVWSPCIHGRAHQFMLASNYRHGKAMSVVNVEGMGLALSGELMRQVKKFEVDTKIGFGQDYWLCYKSRQFGMKNVIDGHVSVYHPAGIGYNEREAHDEFEKAFASRYGADFRREVFNYNQEYNGNLREVRTMLTIVTVDNGWMATNFVELTDHLENVKLVLIKKGIDVLPPLPDSVTVIPYSESAIKEATENADIAFFPRVGTANRSDFEYLLKAGVPTIAFVNDVKGEIAHMATGYVFGNWDWARKWLKDLCHDESLRTKVRNAWTKKETETKTEESVINGRGEIVVESQPISEVEPDDDILVSIITPTYKRAPEIITRSINCLQLQTTSKWEQLICSDGEREEHADKVVKAIDDERVQYHWTGLLKKEGDYGNTVRSEMLKRARGKYVLFCDDDNIIMPEYLETMIRALETGEDDKDFAVCQIMHFGPLNSQVVGHPPQVMTGIPPKLYHIDPLQVLVKREVMQAIGWDTEKGYCADGYTLQELGEKHKHVEVKEVLGVHI